MRERQKWREMAANGSINIPVATALSIISHQVLSSDRVDLHLDGLVDAATSEMDLQWIHPNECHLVHKSQQIALDTPPSPQQVPIGLQVSALAATKRALVLCFEASQHR